MAYAPLSVELEQLRFDQQIEPVTLGSMHSTFWPGGCCW
jgi:hypothetical protein